MPLEEPDTATAGTGTQAVEHDAARGHRVALLVGAATVTILVVAAVFVIAPDRDRPERTRATVARREALRPASEAEAANSESGTTTTGIAPAAEPAPTARAATPASDTPGDRAGDASGDPSSAPGAPPAPSASLPGTPVVAVGGAGPNGCAVSWTVAGGGTPIVEFFVTRESEPAPPGPDGPEIGTAMQVERTTDTTATVGAGWTVRVAARNALGTGPASEPILCG